MVSRRDWGLQLQTAGDETTWTASHSCDVRQASLFHPEMHQEVADKVDVNVVVLLIRKDEKESWHCIDATAGTS